jgi:ribosomal protein L14E/L6E/L27E
MVRDADGNVIYLDAKDQPYVLIQNGKVVYVKVYRARITPSGRDLDAKCTIENPDGKREVLLVEPVPLLSAPDESPL